MHHQRFLSSALGAGLLLGALGLSGPVWAQSVAPPMGSNGVTGPSGLQCTITAQDPHFSQWWFSHYGEYKVDTKGNGTCSEPADTLKAQATLYYAAYIGLTGEWIAAPASPIASINDESSITTKQSNTAWQYLTTNDYYGTAVLWINGGPAQDSPVNGPIEVPCDPSTTT